MYGGLDRGRKRVREGESKNERREDAIKIKNCKNLKGTPKQTAIPWRRTATSLDEDQLKYSPHKKKLMVPETLEFDVECEGRAGKSVANIQA